ncbi:S-layer family protein [Pannus brasiliensis CCIBt3594]|uniref:S-layer family protein n=1 Tax=Pannus brasiliensis CCIBt3594 TaxID=1427578 RepID=A0AAW9QKW3_9CHRO
MNQKYGTNTLPFIFRGFLISVIVGFPASISAQITPDNTLPRNTIVTPENNRFKIDGGTTTGSNLFHSFTDFSLPNNWEAFFNNGGAIQNILVRVTGKNASEINGLIRANGNANLFFINPNGILFGANAALDLGGSFIAGTASSIFFEDGSEFSATNPAASPLLTINLPNGFRYGQDARSIQVLGTGHGLTIGDSVFSFPTRDPSSYSTGLQVKPGNTLALIGGELLIEGATLTASGGNIELGSVGSGRVNFRSGDRNFTFDYRSIDSFNNVRFTRQSLVDVSGLPPVFGGVPSGSIRVKGSWITIAEGSVLLGQNFGPSAGGNLSIEATDSLLVNGTAPDRRIRSQLNTQTFGEGTGGNILISAPRVFLEEGAKLETVTVLGSAKSGDIIINAPDEVRLSGNAPSATAYPSYTSQVGTRTLGAGRSGNIFLSSDRLTLLDGANIFTSGDLGTGRGGDIDLRVTDLIELIGVNPISLFSSGIGVSTLLGGGSGNLTLHTRGLILRDGGRVDASTFASGDAGNVSVTASEFVEVRGTVPNSLNPSLIISSANKLDPILAATGGLPAIPTGNSGSVTITTPRLIVADGAQVTVRNDGTGSAGNLRVNAGSILLENGAGLTASTSSGQGGNILLNVPDLIRLENNSAITATADSTGNGGNITINAGFLVAFPNGNSDITANAFGGRGGAIDISASGIFGTEVRERLTPDNDITAFSLLQPTLNGIITLDIPELDPSRGTIEFPITVVDPDTLIDRNYCRKGTRSELTLTGRGGVPTSPADDLDSPEIGGNLIEPVPPAAAPETPATDRGDRGAKPGNPVIPARGWAYNDRGEVVLTASNPLVTESRSPSVSPVSCPTP